MNASPKTILIVEDNEASRTLLSDYVVSLGHIPLPAEDGRAALALLEKQMPDLVLLDIIMPGIQGYEVLEHLKRNGKLCHIPVIVTTAIDELDSAVRCIQSGADDYLIKPFKQALLKARMGACLEKKDLRDQEQQWRDFLASILQSSTEYAIVATDLNYRIRHYNPKAEQLFGSRALEVIGKTLQELPLGEKMYLRRVEQALPQVLSGGKYEYEVENTDATGNPRCIQCVVTPHKAAAGECVGLLFFCHDITEHKQKDEELRKHRDHLDELVAQRTTQLRTANERLRGEVAERQRSQGRLLAYQDALRFMSSQLSLAEERERRHFATVLHDIVGQRLTLAMIKLKTLRAGIFDASIAESLTEVCQRIDEVIEATQSLTFELSPPVLYQAGLEAAITSLAHQIQKEQGIACRVADDGQPKPLSDDIRVFMFRAVRELLVNVVKHARARNATILIRRDGEKIQVRVEDDGDGFKAPEIGPRVEIAGGFGLFSIRERLDYLGGQIEVDSEPGRGTRVTLMAPLIRPKKDRKEK